MRLRLDLHSHQLHLDVWLVVAPSLSCHRCRVHHEVQLLVVVVELLLEVVLNSEAYHLAQVVVLSLVAYLLVQLAQAEASDLVVDCRMLKMSMVSVVLHLDFQ